MIKIYLAARYSLFPLMQHYAKILRTHNMEVTSRWILGDQDIRARGQSSIDYWMSVWAQEDWDDLLKADTVISFIENPEGKKHGRGRGGRHVELGIELACSKRCIVVGYKENVFHYLPQIEFYTTWDTMLHALVGEK